MRAWKLLELCLLHMREPLADDRPRSFLFRTLEDLRTLSTRWPAEHLALAEPAAALFATVLADALATCAIGLALLRDMAAPPSKGDADDASATAQPPPLSEIASIAVALRAEATRLESLLVLVRTVDRLNGSWAKAVECWNPATLLVQGSLSLFWTKHISKGQTKDGGAPSTSPVAIPRDTFLAAIAACYMPLSEEDAQRLLPWLRPDMRDRINLAEVVSVLDAPGTGGLWRALLFCTSWPELCAEGLIPAVVAGGKEGDLAITDEVLLTEKRSQARAVILPGWSRSTLLNERGPYQALRALGMEMAVDVKGKGLLVQFPSEAVAKALQQPLPALMKTLQELLGKGTPVGFPAKPAAPASVERCISEQAGTMFRIQDGRQRHMTLSQILRRKVLELQDSMQNLMALWHHPQVSEEAGDDRGKSGASTVESGWAALKESHQELWVALREADHWEEAQSAAALRLNASMSAAVPDKDQLQQLEEQAAADAKESARLVAVNSILGRQIQMHAEVSKIESELALLESSFARARRELVGKYKELLQQIAGEEEELLAVSGKLAEKREAAAAIADSAVNLRLMLAERMIRVPPGPIGSTDEIEGQLNS